MKKLIGLLILIVLILSCKSKESGFNQESLEYQDLINKSSEELRLLRNEIYAKHGYIFKSQDLKEYFLSQDWYKPKFQNVDSLLTPEDKENVSLIQQAEAFVKDFQILQSIYIASLDSLIGLIDIPKQLPFLISKLGEPDSTFIDPDEFCPVGQLHFWLYEPLNIKLILLGDEYGEPVDFEVESDLAILQLLNSAKPPTFSSDYQIQLYNDDKQIKTILDEFVRANSSFTLEEFEGKTVIDRFLIDELKKVYWLTDGSIYIHFVINTHNRLEYIIQTDINLRTAC